MRFFPIILLCYVAAEIASLAIAGHIVGVLATLALLFLAFIGGIAAIQSSGLHIQQVFASRPDTPEAASRLASAAMFRFAAGVLLIVPGFFSDILALLLLLPPVERYLGGRFTRHFQFSRTSWQAGRPPDGPIIEGEAVEIEGQIGQPPGAAKH